MNSPQDMILDIKEKYNLDAPKVFSAMLSVPRQEFVPSQFQDLAHDDMAVSIGFGQTISQPYTVAFMTHLLDLRGNEKVLEIGTGSGYQAAILSRLAGKVYTLEIVPGLVKRAKETFKKLGFKNIEVKRGSGEFGWRQEAPFDAIIVTAGLEEIPQELFGQLKDGGVLIAPVGVGQDKTMTRFIKKEGKINRQEYGIFHFVPFIEE